MKLLKKALVIALSGIILSQSVDLPIKAAEQVQNINTTRTGTLWFDNLLEEGKTLKNGESYTWENVYLVTGHNYLLQMDACDIYGNGSQTPFQVVIEGKFPSSPNSYYKRIIRTPDQDGNYSAYLMFEAPKDGYFSFTVTNFNLGDKCFTGAITDWCCD